LREPTNEGERQNAPVWNVDLYASKHDFVWKYGSDVVALLAPQPGERILDIGCGTGHLTSQIFESGANVMGVDRSPEVIAAARKAFPKLNFEIADARSLSFDGGFEAAFSNATLHWIHQPLLVIEGVCRALVPGGRFVAEFGGRGNVRKIQNALDRTLVEFGLYRPGEVNPWYYPSVAEYATLLERGGFEVRFMTLFDRPTALNDGEAGMRNWIAMFGSDFLAKVNPEAQESCLRRVEELLRAESFRDGQWWADYRRLRFVAYK